jgi:tellurite resistance protein TerC
MPEGSTLVFAVFSAFILCLLALDLGVVHRRATVMKMREAVGWSLGWLSLALSFNILIYFMYEGRWLAGAFSDLGGTDAALQFFTGYLIELALSVDNLFIFLVLFSYFGVPARFQHTVLFWGILGAIVLRMVFIVSGALLIQRFEWILYVFGVILLVSGWKMFGHEEIEVHPERNIFIRLVRRFFPVTTDFDTADFVVRRHGRLHLTPMLLVLITVETTDLMFAVDSIPAIFAVTRDPFIVYSSNIFAILGLRSLYFVLAGAMGSFHYLKKGLALVLVVIGVKMLLADIVHLPVFVSLLVVLIVLSTSVVASLIRRRREERAAAGGPR